MENAQTGAAGDAREGQGRAQGEDPDARSSNAALVQGTSEWHLQRQGKLTGSVFAAALGLSPYMSRQRLYRVLTGREAPDVENDAMRRGTECEPIAGDWYEVERGEIVIPVGYVAHPEYDFLGVSPDGFVPPLGRLEIKCPGAGPHTRIPDHYLPQCLGVLHITGGEWIDYVSWHPEGCYVQRVMAKDSADQWKAWEAELVKFYNDYVLGDVEPPRKRRKANGV